MANNKFNIGDKVRINPLARREDFELNYCTPSFMRRLDEVFTIKAYSTYEKGYSYEVKENTWCILERCLTSNKEVNEI